MLTDQSNQSDDALSEGNDLVTLTPEQQITQLLEIQSLLKVGNLRAIDLTEELLARTAGDTRKSVEALLELANNLQFAAAEKAVHTLLEGATA